MNAFFIVLLKAYNVSCDCFKTVKSYQWATYVLNLFALRLRLKKHWDDLMITENIVQFVGRFAIMCPVPPFVIDDLMFSS